MKRRGFLKTMATAAAGSVVLNNLTFNAMAKSQLTTALKGAKLGGEDRVLVLIQFVGGNDGINTLIPVDQYSLYDSIRPGIAIPQPGASGYGSRPYVPLDNNLPSQQQIGLHPDLAPLKTIYDEENLAIIQGVAYPNSNLSHFRSRDVWFMGGGYLDYWPSGWMGRYLDHEFNGYPERYPNGVMPDPLALEIGTRTSLGFNRESGIPAALAIRNPSSFQTLIESVGGPLPMTVSNDRHGDELSYIMGVEESSNKYALRLSEVYSKGANSSSVVYPGPYPYNATSYFQTRDLADQMQTVARLISGGCKTRIYLCKMGGFDTHSGQVDANDSSIGNHGALMYHFSQSVKAFLDDMKALGLEDKVIVASMSEFGRRVNMNDSLGTDHGSAAPVFVAGKAVNKIVVGDAPRIDANSLDNVGNIQVQNDYRQIFTDILQDWMGATPEALTAARFDSFAANTMNIIDSNYAIGEENRCPCH